MAGTPPFSFQAERFARSGLCPELIFALYNYLTVHPPKQNHTRNIRPYGHASYPQLRSYLGLRDHTFTIQSLAADREFGYHN